MKKVYKLGLILLCGMFLLDVSVYAISGPSRTPRPVQTFKSIPTPAPTPKPQSQQQQHQQRLNQHRTDLGDACRRGRWGACIGGGIIGAQEI